jgi:hypothetical protein
MWIPSWVSFFISDLLLQVDRSMVELSNRYLEIILWSLTVLVCIHLKVQQQDVYSLEGDPMKLKHPSAVHFCSMTVDPHMTSCQSVGVSTPLYLFKTEFYFPVSMVLVCKFYKRRCKNCNFASSSSACSIVLLCGQLGCEFWSCLYYCFHNGFGALKFNFI